MEVKGRHIMPGEFNEAVDHFRAGDYSKIEAIFEKIYNFGREDGLKEGSVCCVKKLKQVPKA
jgi:dihydrodipicolinate synthase/N-acetylneuraminate lyase